MALRDGTPWLVFGSMGGDAQAAVHVQVLAHVLDDAAIPPTHRAPLAGRPGHMGSPRGDAFDVTTIAAPTRAHDVTVTTAFDSGMGHRTRSGRRRGLRRTVRSPL